MLMFRRSSTHSSCYRIHNTPSTIIHSFQCLGIRHHEYQKTGSTMSNKNNISFSNQVINFFAKTKLKLEIKDNVAILCFARAKIWSKAIRSVSHKMFFNVALCSMFYNCVIYLISSFECSL